VATVVQLNQSLLIISNSVGGGGAENAMRNLLNGLVGRLPVRLVALNSDNSNLKTQDEIIILNRKWGAGFLSTTATLFSLRKVLKEVNPSVLIVNCELPELLIAFSGSWRRKIICVEHTSNPWAGRKFLGVIVRRILLIKRVQWVTVSRDEKKIWHGGKGASHIPNPVDVPKLGNPPREVNAIFLGRLTQSKRPDWAIQASLEADIELQIFGDGPLMADLKKNQKELMSRVKFHGYTESCWDQISKNDILLMPSAFEGDGIVVVQAILAGMRILLADNNDLRRFNLPDDCYCKNAEEMAQKLINAATLGVDQYRATPKARDELFLERNLESVSAKWIKYLAQL
jgi:glycosyltransferase involved in cell wall biosynthesis